MSPDLLKVKKCKKIWWELRKVVTLQTLSEREREDIERIKIDKK